MIALLNTPHVIFHSQFSFISCYFLFSRITYHKMPLQNTATSSTLLPLKAQIPVPQSQTMPRPHQMAQCPPVPAILFPPTRHLSDMPHYYTFSLFRLSYILLLNFSHYTTPLLTSFTKKY
jgi:hypothetical protein